ncbi:hypothetical protein SACC_13100 [Saccharolobus caldissimus]|uniref:Uncharacterized protein n=1 Tax=Saccharolobus caldissimus TaxID=1702097 RepID=A0AAQ4CR62_9CREN|nr:hypothetical protein SACC_13100 [Saccharolobus caldissimus]
MFPWVLCSQRYGKQRYEKLVDLWGKAKDLVKGKVVGEMWTYLFKAFYKWVFICFVYTSLGLYFQLVIGMRGSSRKFWNMLQRVGE